MIKKLYFILFLETDKRYLFHWLFVKLFVRVHENICQRPRKPRFYREGCLISDKTSTRKLKKIEFLQLRLENLMQHIMCSVVYKNTKLSLFTIVFSVNFEKLQTFMIFSILYYLKVCTNWKLSKTYTLKHIENTVSDQI